MIFRNSFWCSSHCCGKVPQAIPGRPKTAVRPAATGAAPLQKTRLARDAATIESFAMKGSKGPRTKTWTTHSKDITAMPQLTDCDGPMLGSWFALHIQDYSLPTIPLGSKCGNDIYFEAEYTILYIDMYIDM